MYDVSHYSIWCTNSDKALAPPLATLPFPVRLDISLGGGESSLFCSNDPKVSKESTKLRIALPDFSAWFWDGHTVDSLKDHAPLAFLYVCIKCVWEYPFKKTVDFSLYQLVPVEFRISINSVKSCAMKPWRYISVYWLTMLSKESILNAFRKADYNIYDHKLGSIPKKMLPSWNKSEKEGNTVDGQNPPPRMMTIPLFIGF